MNAVITGLKLAVDDQEFKVIFGQVPRESVPKQQQKAQLKIWVDAGQWWCMP